MGGPRTRPQDPRGRRTFLRATWSLASNVADLRQARNLTLEALDGRTGVHYRHIQKIEAAAVNVTLLTLARLADGLGVRLADLLHEREIAAETGREEGSRS